MTWPKHCSLKGIIFALHIESPKNIGDTLHFQKQDSCISVVFAHSDVLDEETFTVQTHLSAPQKVNSEERPTSSLRVSFDTSQAYPSTLKRLSVLFFLAEKTCPCGVFFWNGTTMSRVVA